MDKIKKFEGSVSQDDFILGLLSASKTNHLGEIWEKCVACPECKFAEQCDVISRTLEAQEPAKNPTCRDIINVLLGEIKVEETR